MKHHCGSLLLKVFVAAMLTMPLVVSAQRQIFHAYGAADGLSNLNVRCLFQDRIGYIWVGTDNGLFRYDGVKFKAFGHSQGLADTEILSIAQSPEGTLWIGTNSGLAVLSGNHFDVVKVGETDSTRAIVFDANRHVYLLHDADIIRGTLDEKGNYHFEPVVHGKAKGLSYSDGEVFFGLDGDLWQFHGEHEERIGRTAGLPADDWGATVHDTLGNMWVRSKYLLYELPHGQTRFIDRSKGLPSTTDGRLYADVHGNIFVPTISGITVLSESQRTTLDTGHGLPADPSGPMLIDRENLVWIGTNGGGLVRRLGHGEWLAWTKQDGLPKNSVWSIQSDETGRHWIGTDGGLSILDLGGKVTRSYNGRNGLAGDRVLSIARGPGGELFVGTDPAGISQFSRNGALIHTYRSKTGFLTERVSSMAFDGQQRLWAVGNAGCYRSTPLQTGQRLRFEQMNIPGLPAQTIFREVLLDDDGSVWIASSRGLIHFVGGHWKVFSERDGLRSDDLGVVEQVHGELWIAYRDSLGAARVSFNGPNPSVFPVTVQDGLRSDAVYAITSDRKGRIWLSTDMGVDVFDQGRWKHLGSEDGLIWDDTDSLALQVDSAGDVWIGTSGGLSRYAHPDFAVVDWSPPVVLTLITNSFQEWQTNEEPAVPFEKRALSIQFAALSYGSMSSVRYRYRLIGSDSNWTETAEPSVHFAALPPGHYSFEVTALDLNGVWNPVPTRFTFSIVPPWWRTWWFMAVTGFAALFLVSASVRLRLRRLEFQKKSLEIQVADRTAELVASHKQLEEIAYYDALTNMPNRRRFSEELDKRLSAEGGKCVFTLLLLDLDFFKSINDRFGHDAGDCVLFETGRRLKEELRETEFVARLGGDEFAILLATAVGEVAIETVCKRILTSIASPIPHKGVSLHVGCSIGIASFPQDAQSQEVLYKLADLALYRAKQSSRNAFCWHKPADAEALVATSIQ